MAPIFPRWDLAPTACRARICCGPFPRRSPPASATSTRRRSIEMKAEVGACVQASGLDHADVFLTTKVWVTNYAKGAFATSVDDSLRRLRTDYIDLLLLH